MFPSQQDIKEAATYVENITPLGPWLLSTALAVLEVLVFLLIWYRASESRKIKYRFITVGSHKLRTPLTKIKIAVSELIGKKEGADARGDTYTVGDYDERMLRQIAIENNRLVGLVNLLLEVSESEHKRIRYEFEEFDIVELIRGLLVGYQNSQWRNDRTFIEFESAESSIFVRADKRRVSSVVQVFLENAITYSPAGGKITVSLAKDGRKVRFSITDPGIGITDHEHRHVFTEFYRSERAMRIDTEGTGVGLFLAKNIIEKHGGAMGFVSEGEHRGSTFFFTVPAASAPAG